MWSEMFCLLSLALKNTWIVPTFFQTTTPINSTLIKGGWPFKWRAKTTHLTLVSQMIKVQYYWLTQGYFLSENSFFTMCSISLDADSKCLESRWDGERDADLPLMIHYYNKLANLKINVKYMSYSTSKPDCYQFYTTC